VAGKPEERKNNIPAYLFERELTDEGWKRQPDGNYTNGKQVIIKATREDGSTVYTLRNTSELTIRSDGLSAWNPDVGQQESVHACVDKAIWAYIEELKRKKKESDHDG